ncbi:MAG: PRC-barrel domain-containing protein [Ktedonobacteraceae bacterium]
MVDTSSLRKWALIQGLPVIALNSTLTVGIIEDFYFEPDTNAVRAFRVKRGILGYRSVPANAIAGIERDRVTVINDQMVVEEDHDRRLSQLPLGHDLFAYKVMSESGAALGIISNIILDTQPPIALRIAAYEIVAENGRGRGKMLNADEVTLYEDRTMYVLDTAAKALR